MKVKGILLVLSRSSNYDTDLSLTGKRGLPNHRGNILRQEEI